MLEKLMFCLTGLVALLSLHLTYETLQTGAGSGLLISMLEKLIMFCLMGQKSSHNKKERRGERKHAVHVG